MRPFKTMRCNGTQLPKLNTSAQSYSEEVLVRFEPTIFWLTVEQAIDDHYPHLCHSCSVVRDSVTESWRWT